MNVDNSPHNIFDIGLFALEFLVPRNESNRAYQAGS
jgi:hypothetical protein